MIEDANPLSIFFGWNKQGKKVFIPLFHLFINATSGAGKTVILKHLLWRFHLTHPDWSILIIDSKDKREFEDLNSDIPLCFVETTEPLDLKDLMEPLLGSKTLYYLDKIIEEAVYNSLEEIQTSIEAKIEKADKGKLKIHGKELGKLRVINHTFKKIVKFIKEANVTPELKLKPGFNVMNVSMPKVKEWRLKRAFQQLILRSTIVKLSEPEFEKVLFVHDEFHKSSPQRWSSIVKQPLSDGVSEGRSKEVFFWFADQAMTKVDKEPLKPVKVWIVGQQMEDNEIEDAVNSVNDITDLKVGHKDIKRLGIGSFLVVDGINLKVEEAYFQPNGVPDELAIEIARGNKAPQEAESYIKSFKFKVKPIEGEDMSALQNELEQTKKERDKYKEKFETLEKSLPTIRSQIYNEIQKNFSENYIEKSEQNKIIQGFKDQIGQVSKELEKTNEKFVQFETLNNVITNIINTRLQEVLPDALSKVAVASRTTPTPPSSIDAISLGIEIDKRINQRFAKEPEIRVVQVDLDEQIIELNKQEFLRPIIEATESLSEPMKRATRYIYEKKQTTIGDLNFFLYQKTGRPPGTLKINILTPLSKAFLIDIQADKIKWILPETLFQHIKDETEVSKLEKYILSKVL